MIWFGHMERICEAGIPEKGLEAHEEGRRLKGRPRKRWIDRLKEDN